MPAGMLYRVPRVTTTSTTVQPTTRTTRRRYRRRRRNYRKKGKVYGRLTDQSIYRLSVHSFKVS
jgi:hypothetical protein